MSKRPQWMKNAAIELDTTIDAVTPHCHATLREYASIIARHYSAEAERVKELRGVLEVTLTEVTANHDEGLCADCFHEHDCWKADLVERLRKALEAWGK